MTFLIAKLRSRIVLIEVGKDKIANITTSIYSHGSLRPKGRDRGYYIASQGSIFPTRIGRVPLAICYDQLAPSVDPKFLLAMKELEKIPVEYDVQRVEPKKNTLIWEKHHRITNITDLQNWLEFAKKHQEKIEFAQLIFDLLVFPILIIASLFAAVFWPLYAYNKGIKSFHDIIRLKVPFYPNLLFGFLLMHLIIFV